MTREPYKTRSGDPNDPLTKQAAWFFLNEIWMPSCLSPCGWPRCQSPNTWMLEFLDARFQQPSNQHVNQPENAHLESWWTIGFSCSIMQFDCGPLASESKPNRELHDRSKSSRGPAIRLSNYIFAHRAGFTRWNIFFKWSRTCGIYESKYPQWANKRVMTSEEVNDPDCECISLWP